MQRDVLFAEQVRIECEERGICCIVNDGAVDIDAVYEMGRERLGI